MNHGVATTERSVPIQDPIELEGGGARQPRNKPNTRSGLEGSVVMDKRVARKRAVPNHAEYKLTSYAAWWHRVEKLGTQFYKEVRRDEEKRRKMIEEKEKKRKDKESFVRKFFPSCENSPGGTLRLNAVRRNIPAEHEAMRKIEGNLEHLSPSRMTNFNDKQGGLIKSEPVIKLFGGSSRTRIADMEKVISASSDDLG